MKRFASLIVVSALLAGCNQLLGESKSIHFSSAAPMLKQDESIIATRLREHASSLSPSYSFAHANGQTVVHARGVPPDQSVQFLLKHRGEFEARSANGRPWFSQRDIVDAQAGIDDRQRTVLRLKLSPEAGARVARLSANEVGTVVSAVLDGEVLAAANVSAPIQNGALQLTINKTPNEAVLISTILKTGSLSFAPGSVQVQAGP